MMQIFLRSAIRSFWKYKRYSFINMTGMSVGLACLFLLLIYVNYEKNYDTFYENGNRLYRLNYHANFTGSTYVIPRVPAPMAPLIPDHFPGVEEVTRLYPRGISVRDLSSDQQFEVENAFFADSNVQKTFQFTFLKGDPHTALNVPFSIVLTDFTAKRFFGDQDPMDRQLKLANTGPFTVTGVIRALPENSHIEFDLLVPYRNMSDVEPVHARPAVENMLNSNWIASHSYTYVLLKENHDPQEINEAFPEFLRKFGMPDFIEKQAFELFPVRDIHLHSTSDGEPVARANPTYLKLFVWIGFLILLIACINFINLSTATYMNRLKEVGVRKVLGAGKGALILQFMGETMLLSSFSFILALLLVHLALPYFGAIMDKNLTLDIFSNPVLLFELILFFIFSGVLAGGYPAFYAARFLPVQIFQSRQGGQRGRDWFRRFLITTQFTVGITLITCTLIILSQLDYWKAQPLGFTRDQIIGIPLSSNNINSVFAPGDSGRLSKMRSFEEQLLSNSHISHVTLASGLPGFGTARHPIRAEKVTTAENVFLQAMSVDHDFAETFDLQLLAGRDFDELYGEDISSGFLINELAVTALKWNSPEEAIGKLLVRGGKEGKVTGVIRNYHTGGLQSGLEPLVLEVSPGMYNTFAVRLQAGDFASTLDFVEKTWNEFFPEKAFEYQFLDDRLAQHYTQEEQLAGLARTFALIAVFLSCFGLFGMISLNIYQRTREIGIRKVLGATVSGIVLLLSRHFLVLIFAAMIIAAPVAWLLMEEWLNDFVFRIHFRWWYFVLPGVIAAVSALLTMCFQTLQAALANPVKSLKTE